MYFIFFSTANFWWKIFTKIIFNLHGRINEKYYEMRLRVLRCKQTNTSKRHSCHATFPLMILYMYYMCLCVYMLNLRQRIQCLLAHKCCWVLHTSFAYIFYKMKEREKGIQCREYIGYTIHVCHSYVFSFRLFSEL